jgi:hypothetical protein
VETDPLTAARESVKKVNMNRAMKDDSNKDLLMMSLVQSLCLQGNCLRKVILLMITFGRRAILSINDIGEDSSRAGENPISRIEDNIENAMDAFVLAALIRTIIKMYPNLEDRYTILLKDMRL